MKHAWPKPSWPRKWRPVIRKMCVACLTKAECDSHHIIYNYGPDWETNLCKPCHGEITSRNAKARNLKGRTLSPQERLKVWNKFITDRLAGEERSILTKSSSDSETINSHQQTVLPPIYAEITDSPRAKRVYIRNYARPELAHWEEIACL